MSIQQEQLLATAVLTQTRNQAAAAYQLNNYDATTGTDAALNTAARASQALVETAIVSEVIANAVPELNQAQQEVTREAASNALTTTPQQVLLSNSVPNASTAIVSAAAQTSLISVLETQRINNKTAIQAESTLLEAQAGLTSSGVSGTAVQPPAQLALETATLSLVTENATSAHTENAQEVTNTAAITATVQQNPTGALIILQSIPVKDAQSDAVLVMQDNIMAEEALFDHNKNVLTQQQAVAAANVTKYSSTSLQPAQEAAVVAQLTPTQVANDVSWASQSILPNPAATENEPLVLKNAVNTQVSQQATITNNQVAQEVALLATGNKPNFLSYSPSKT